MRTNRMYWTDYLFILPGLLLSVFIILVPGVMTIFYGFTDWNGCLGKL